MNGFAYLSFKYADTEGLRNGRWFNSYDERTFQELLLRHPALGVIELWVTTDIRPGRANEKWINIVLQRL